MNISEAQAELARRADAERRAAEEAQLALKRHITAVADVIRAADTLIAVLSATSSREYAQVVDGVLLQTRQNRHEAFIVMTRLNPDQAWFWTEEWQAKEREADADETAGRTTFHATTEDFLAAIKLRQPAIADA